MRRLMKFPFDRQHLGAQVACSCVGEPLRARNPVHSDPRGRRRKPLKRPVASSWQKPRGWLGETLITLVHLGMSECGAGGVSAPGRGWVVDGAPRRDARVPEPPRPQSVYDIVAPLPCTTAHTSFMFDGFLSSIPGSACQSQPDSRTMQDGCGVPRIAERSQETPP